MSINNMLNRVQSSADKKRLFMPHALLQMSRPDRIITTKEVRMVIENGKIIEDYPNNQEGTVALCLDMETRIGQFMLFVHPKKISW